MGDVMEQNNSMAGASLLCPTRAELGFPPLSSCTYPPLWRNQVFFQKLAAQGSGKKPGSDILSSHKVSRGLNALFIVVLGENKIQSATVLV